MWVIYFILQLNSLLYIIYVNKTMMGRKTPQEQWEILNEKTTTMEQENLLLSVNI